MIGRKIIFLSACAGMLLGFFVWYGYHSVDSGEGKPLVVCTTTFLSDIVMNLLAGEDVRQVCLMGPGIDPHTYKAQPRDLDVLTQADFVVYHGLALEGKMAESLAQLGARTSVCCATDGIDSESLLCVDEFFGVYDPHVWFAPLVWKEVAVYCAYALSQKFPQYAHSIAQRLEFLVAEYEALDLYLRRLCDQVPQNRRILVTAHNAFGYFGKAYGIATYGLQGLSTEAEVSMKDIEQCAEFVVQHEVPVVFGETSVPRKALEAVVHSVQSQGYAVKCGIDLCSDSLGAQGTQSATYAGMMRFFGELFVGSLCQKEPVS